jgi:beta-lactamase superfamily II metal-dependent hydrolase
MIRFVICFAVALAMIGSACAGTLKVFYPATHTGWVLETPSGKTYVIDPGVSDEFYDTAPKHGTGIGTYLKQRGIKTVDAVIISHPHPDHFAAGVQLFRDFKVLELIDTGFNPKTNRFGGYTAEFWNAFKKSGAKHLTGLRAGAMLNLDPELTAKVLGPKNPFGILADAGNDPERFYNENSLVLWVKHGGVSYLFTGDITPIAQKFLRTTFVPEISDTAVFAIPHHGKYYHDDVLGKLLGSAHPSVRLGIASISHTKKGPKADRVPVWRKDGLTVLTGDGHNDITVISNGGNDFTVQTTKPASRRVYRVEQR